MAAAPSVAVPNGRGVSHPYTCNTCQVAFKGSELQRSHMQSDWHRYNLKRRVASLPPLTSEVFAEKVLANQASAAATAARASFEKVCAACQRTYFSENAYQNHLQSQKHKTRQAVLAQDQNYADTETASMTSSAFSLGEPTPVHNSSRMDEREDEEENDPVADAEFAEVISAIKETHLEDRDPVDRRPSRPRHSAEPGGPVAPSPPISSSTATPIPTSVDSVTTDPTLACLFCNIRFPETSQNIEHMRKTHGLFIPEQSYLVDLPGLLNYLHERVDILHECLYCGHVKHSTIGIQTHMRDKGHCMIAFESEEQMIEVGQFYDFSSTYSDDELEDDESTADNQSSVKQGGVKLGAPRATTYSVTGEVNEVLTNGDVEEDDDWESDEDEGDDIDMVNNGVKSGAQPSSRSDNLSSNRAYQLDDELHLPSGRTAGHRSLAKYYRQNLRNYPTPDERIAQQQRLIADRNTDEGEADSDSDQIGPERGRQIVSRANGGMGMLSAPEGKKKEARAIEMKDVKRAQRAQDRYQWGNERRANFQKHFRDPLLQ